MRLTEALLATWPSASEQRIGPVRIRDGQGMGGRVDAAIIDGPMDNAALARAEPALAALGPHRRWLLRVDQSEADALLAKRGYQRGFPTDFMSINPHRIAPSDAGAPSAAWPPGAAERALWAEAGTGPERIAIMERAAEPKAALMARLGADPAGICFIAHHKDIAMAHALFVPERCRRKGIARALMRGAAGWARAAKASVLARLLDQTNRPARALYEGLGFTARPGLHYRFKEDPHD